MPTAYSENQPRALARLERAVAFEQTRLKAIERRLGTDQEGESDLDDAREIAHELSNLKLLLTLTRTRPDNESILEAAQKPGQRADPIR